MAHIREEGLPDKTQECSVMLTLARPEASQLQSYNRAERYRILRQNSDRVRENLLEWLAAHGYDEEVSYVGEPTAFNLLFVTSTRRVAEALPGAPGVVGVSLTDDFAMETPPVERRIVYHAATAADDDVRRPVAKVPRDAIPSDYAYWQQHSAESRLAALESTRSEYNRWKYGSRPAFQRVLNVTERE
jgi:hypothetical protein